MYMGVEVLLYERGRLAVDIIKCRRVPGMRVCYLIMAG